MAASSASSNLPPWADLTALVAAAIAAAAQAAFKVDDIPEIQLGRPPSIEQGELAYACFPLARIARRSPAQIAQALAEGLEGSAIAPWFDAITPAGPYLNFTLGSGALFGAVDAAVSGEGDAFGRSDVAQGRSVMVEFSAPNTNKPQHLGHVRNIALGWSVCNLLDAVGYRVIRANLINDRGVHICKSMLAYERWGEGTDPSRAGLKGDHLVGSFYVRFSKALKEQQEALRDEAARETGLSGDALDAHLETAAPLAREAQEMLQRWEAGDADVRALWAKMNGWVLAGFEETYKRLGIRFDRIYLESQTYQRGRQIVLDALESGQVYRKEDGSTWINLESAGLPEKILLRRDGTSLYFTQDLGTAVIKHEDFGMDRSIYVVATEQDYHFQQLFAALKQLGYAWADGLFHLSYGLVHLPDGKMKSREGTTVDADDLMDTLEAACLEKAQEALSQGGAEGRSEAELLETSRQVAQGALKFFILRVNPRKEMIFNPQESISLQGDTGPYVQYAHARIRSLIEKGRQVGMSPADARSRGLLSLLGNPEERAIALSIARLPEMVREAADKLAPSTITTWLLELATGFNRFYNAHPVLKADPDLATARLALCEDTAIALANGLKLLGIPAPDAM